MQKLQDSVFSIVKTTNLSPAVFNFLQPSDDTTDKTPLGGILNDTRHGWLALGPKFCVVDLRTGLKVAAKIFGTSYSNSRATITGVEELPVPLTDNSKQLIVSLSEDLGSTIYVFHINGSQVLRCIQTDLIVTQLVVCDGLPDGPFSCFDGVVMAGTKSGEIFVFDLNRAGLIQAIKDISQGYEHLIQNENNPASLTFLPMNALEHFEEQRDLAIENNDHLALLINDNSLLDNQYLFRNPDSSIRMKAKRDHIRVTVMQYIPQLGSLVVGYNFGAFQIWNLLTLELEYTSQVNVECIPVTHFGFQEPCDDPRAFCYLWVVYSAIDRFEDEQFPLAVMYSLTYHGKRMLSDTKCLYQEFSMASTRFQVELAAMANTDQLSGGKCVSCHTYSINSTLGSEGEDSMLNICQLVWECWGDNPNYPSQYGMVLFDLDQWYKDQMPETYRLQSNAFMSATWCSELSGACALDARLEPSSVAPYSHATRLEEHFYPNSLQYRCICLTTSEACVLSTVGIQRQIINSIDDAGPTALLNPPRLYHACLAAGLSPLYTYHYNQSPSQDDQRRFLLSVALEARLSRFLKRCAHDWATGTHVGSGCTLTFLVDWCWKRAIELKENAKELTAPLFSSSALPDRNVVRCLEHCVQQLTQLTGLLDAVLTKCCNLVVPDALSEIEEKYKGVGTVSLYFQVVQWFLRVGLLPERHEAYEAVPYPAHQLYATYNKRRMKLQRLEENAPIEDKPSKSCSLLYIDQLIENEFGGEAIHQMWIKGGSECKGLYPPPSLYSLLRLYLLPGVAEEHKHSLVLYMLVDYSVIYDQVKYEAVIRRLMQFPTMFGLSNTAIKATQAFWHLDHRDFDFALDQLQCLTGNTLSEWQHNVVLNSLLAQKKTQAALQYLHVRKPAPIQAKDALNSSRVDTDKLEDWQSCCNLYLARGLVFEALDVIRMCVQNAGCLDDKIQVLNFFFKGIRNTGHLSKILQVSLLPLEEEVFIKYLQNCNEPQTSDILVVYYLQQTRYIEAEQYNKKLKMNKTRNKDSMGSVESLAEILDRENARDTAVELACASLPSVTSSVRDFVLSDKDIEPHVIAPKPMSVYIQATSPKNIFTYKSSFIQDTIENASETWINKPNTRRGLKRALNIEEVPFICTPKLNKNRSFLGDQQLESTPAKRLKLDFNATPKTANVGSAVKVSEKLTKQMATLLDMPEVQSPECKLYIERSGAGTPHSILKIRRNDLDREAPSPVDSRYLGDSDDDMLETASNHTHYSDSTNKHLRFTIPTASESGSTPSPVTTSVVPLEKYKDTTKEGEVSLRNEGEDDSNVTTETHAINESHPLESPPKKRATEATVQTRKSYKDSVRARRSLSISANSSLSDDPNTSVESIADIPITLINPRYSGEKIRAERKRQDSIELHEAEQELPVQSSQKSEVPKTPKGRKGIRTGSENTPRNRSRSVTPERVDSPMTPLHTNRNTRSRSRTPEISPRSSPLEPIIEQKQEETEVESTKIKVDVPRRLRSKSRTPERMNKIVTDSPKLEVITESPTKSSTESSSPTRRSLRSRSRTPEVEIKPEETRPASPRSLRSRAKTPEKIMTPKPEHSTRSKKSLSRLVLEANTFAKTKLNLEHNEQEQPARESTIECTPMKALKQVHSLMDVTLSPIVHKSVLQSSSDSVMSETVDKDTTKPDDKSITDLGLQPLPAFTTIHETYFEKSVLHSYDSSIADTSESIEEDVTKAEESAPAVDLKSLPAFTTINEPGMKSVLHSYESSVAETSESFTEEGVQTKVTETVTKTFTEIIETNIDKSVLKSYNSSVAESSQDNTNKDVNMSLITNDSDVEMKEDKAWDKIENQDTASVIQKEKEKIVDIEREINELECDMTDDDESDVAESDVESSSGDEEIVEPDSNKSTAGSSEESDPTASESDEEIISINDTDSDESSSSENKLEIVDADSYDSNKPSSTKDAAQSQREEISDNKEEQKDTLDIEQKDDTKDPLAQSEKEITADATDEGNGRKSPLNQDQLSMLTDDSSVVEPEHSDVNLNYTDENKPRENKGNTDAPVETEPVVTIVITVEDVKTTSEDKAVAVVAKDVDVMDSIANTDKANIAEEKDKTNTAEQEPEVDDIKDKIMETEAELINQKDAEKQVAEQSSKPGPKTRKRVGSISSNKSITENKTEDIEEPKTPSTRKRTQSNASHKTEPEQKTPEAENTPRRRAKTPTSTEVRKIMTRRASKEIAEKMDESKEALDDVLTPKRRTTRVRSKVDDNESVASESSVKSNRSRVSEDAGDAKTPVRKGRKSLMVTKPDLSVIPEMIAEEDSKGTEDIINEYSSSRRLTRHQKAVLESWLEPTTSPSRPRSRPASRARRVSQDVASVASDVSRDDEDDDKSGFEVHSIDRISLLNKQDFQGSPDPDELRNASPESIASDASKQRRSRLGRAGSESKALPKAAKVFRRVSVDVAPAERSDVGSPVPGGSPARGRRASFNKACEALHTPKGGRTSTDTRKDAESPLESPAPTEASTTPARRTRRTASTQSNTSQAKSDSGKRSKKTLDESKVKD